MEEWHKESLAFELLSVSKPKQLQTGRQGQTKILNYGWPTKHFVVTLKSQVTSKIFSMAIRPKEGSDQTSQWQEVGSAPLQSSLGRMHGMENCLILAHL